MSQSERRDCPTGGCGGTGEDLRAHLLEGLNPDQAAAVTSPASRLLVLAGAGSGKTFVITRRIAHLIVARKVNPENILAITFTRNAAREMATRIREELGPEYLRKPVSVEDNSGAARALAGLQVRTFHSLCYLLLRRHSSLLYEKSFRLVTDSPLSTGPADFQSLRFPTKGDLLLEATRRCFADPGFRISFKRYLWDYLVFSDETDRLGGLGDPRLRKLLTLAGISVRSYAERDIANWLHERNIAFVYDQPAEWSKPRFSPDFYLPALEAYLEVWEFENRKYQKQRQAKLAQYKQQGKRLIEVERRELLDFPRLEARLAAEMPEVFPGGIDGGRTADLDHLRSQVAGYPEALNSFLGLAEEVLDKIKNYSLDLRTIAARVAVEKHRRTRCFYNIFLRVYQSYQDLLRQEGALDFNDLILQTVHLLQTNPELRESYRGRWSHVLVDEYQDVNTPQVALLGELAGPNVSLTCVGDDWQSIYGFRGSNVAHILNFSADFPRAETITLRVNYRSGQSVVNFSSQAIQKSRRFIPKQIEALKGDVQRIIVYRAVSLLDDGIEYVIARVRELLEQGGHKPEEIMVLYRRASSFRVLGQALGHAGLKVRRETIHGAKGLEARAVFIWALHGGRGGFPSVWEDGKIIGLIRPFDLDLRLDEERRVFYVALTRARERLFLVTERRNPSEFLKDAQSAYFDYSGAIEWEKKDEARERACPVCGGVLRVSWRFCPACFHGLENR